MYHKKYKKTETLVTVVFFKSHLKLIVGTLHAEFTSILELHGSVFFSQ